MTILESLKPKPLPSYIPETPESKEFNLISDALNKVGIHGEDNMIETCRILGLKGCCDSSTKIEEHDSKVRADAFDECINCLVMIMPAEPFIKSGKHYENWKTKTAELRMLHGMLEQLKENKE